MQIYLLKMKTFLLLINKKYSHARVAMDQYKRQCSLNSLHAKEVCFEALLTEKISQLQKEAKY